MISKIVFLIAVLQVHVTQASDRKVIAHQSGGKREPHRNLQIQTDPIVEDPIVSNYLRHLTQLPRPPESAPEDNESILELPNTTETTGVENTQSIAQENETIPLEVQNNPEELGQDEPLVPECIDVVALQTAIAPQNVEGLEPCGIRRLRNRCGFECTDIQIFGIAQNIASLRSQIYKMVCRPLENQGVNNATDFLLGNLDETQIQTVERILMSKSSDIAPIVKSLELQDSKYQKCCRRFRCIRKSQFDDLYQYLYGNDDVFLIRECNVNNINTGLQIAQELLQLNVIAAEQVCQTANPNENPNRNETNPFLNTSKSAGSSFTCNNCLCCCQTAFTFGRVCVDCINDKCCKKKNRSLLKTRVRKKRSLSKKDEKRMCNII